MAEVKTEALARQLDAAQAITHVGSWEWDIQSGSVSWSDELYRIYGLEPRSRPVTLEMFLSSLLPEDRDRIQGEIQSALARKGRFSYRERIVRPDGTVRVLDTIGEVVSGDDGAPISLLGTCRDVTDTQRAERLVAGEREALEKLASGASLHEVLAVIVRFIEEAAPASLASILLLDEAGERLSTGAAPSLPEAYTRAIDGAPIGARAGSCGTAVFRKQPVFVEDITTDPLWDDYRHLLAEHGLRACWSIPICTAEGRVLGTFAIYYKEPRMPDQSSRDLIERAAHVAGIAIERRQLDDQQRALAARIERAREEERTHIAREIHDELGQALTALKLDVHWIARRANGNEELRIKLADMAAATDAIIQSVRRISAELRPGILDAIGLRAALEWQAEEFSRRTGTPCTMRADAAELQLDRELATAVFRIFQEALTNVTRHAGATIVDVHLWLERGNLRLDIADDGIGVPEIAPRASTLGLLGMRERARRCGGECAIRRREPRGTLVALTVPLRFPSERDRELGT
jgi:PAS domain S-box-containing protein